MSCNMTEEDIFVSALRDQLLDQQPPIQELARHAIIANWKQLGVQLKLNSMALAGCDECINMYQLWIMEKAENATRRNLITALRAIRQNYVADAYEHYLKKMVS